MRRYPRRWRLFIISLSIFGGQSFFLLHLSTQIFSTTTTTRTTTTTTTTTTTWMAPVHVLSPPPFPTTAIDLEARYYRRQETIVNPFPYVLVKSPRTACPDGILVIVVHSHTSYRDRRDAIRRTWGCYGNGQQEEPRSTRLVFALGV